MRRRFQGPLLLLLVQIIGGEDRRRTLTPLALRERYSALNEPAMGISATSILDVFKGKGSVPGRC